MGEVSGSGLSREEILAMVAGALPVSGVSFVNGGEPLPVASLLANFPASEALLFKYARVTDLFGQANSLMVCEASSGVYYWRPQRSDFAAQSSATSGGVNLVPLVSPPILFLTGALTGQMTLTPSAVNAWPGATFTVVSKGALNLFGISITGLIGSSVPLLTGNQRVITYIAGQGWMAG